MFVLGACCLGISAGYHIFLYLQFRWLKIDQSRKAKVLRDRLDHHLKLLKEVVNEPYLIDRKDSLLRQSPSRYISCLTRTPTLRELQAYGQQTQIVSIPLVAAAETEALRGISNTLILAHYEPMHLRKKLNSTSEEHRVVDMVKEIHSCLERASPFSGILLTVSDFLDFDSWNLLCKHLKNLNLLVFLELMPPYLHLSGIDLGHSDGLIVRNAAVLPDGQRRDYFQAYELRDVLGRCARQKAQRPQFQTILYDPCDLPSVPVLARAFKFARFHDALLTVCRKTETGFLDCALDQEPLRAFDWLRRPDVLDFCKRWNESEISDIEGESSQVELPLLEPLMKGVTAAFVTEPGSGDIMKTTSRTQDALTLQHDPPGSRSIFSYSADGVELSRRACYDLREPVCDAHVAMILKGQRHLRSLNLLQQLSVTEMTELLQVLGQLPISVECSGTKRLVKELLMSLRSGSIAVYRGLDTGFSLPNNRLHMWAVYEKEIGQHIIYMSRNTTAIPAVLLHTFLLVHGVPRQACFELEMFMKSGDHEIDPFPELPARMSLELRAATNFELLNYLYRINSSADRTCQLLEKFGLCAKKLLIKQTTRLAWRKIHAQYLLTGKATLQQLYQTRVDHLNACGFRRVPYVLALVRMHKKIEKLVIQALRKRDQTIVNVLMKALIHTYNSSLAYVSMEADLLALMTICAFRKIACEEAYIEISDRCPIYQNQKDQPGILAEMWFTGSQCEVYFDLTANQLGEMLYAMRRNFLENNPPEPQSHNATTVMNVYEKVDDPSMEGHSLAVQKAVHPFSTRGSQVVPRLQKFSYISVFSSIALLEVILLLCFGQGMILSALMTPTELYIITISLIISLVLTSGNVVWIATSSAYYLSNAAFDSSNYFMVQRFSSSLIICCSSALLGGLGFWIRHSLYSGMLYASFAVAFSASITLVGMLASMHADEWPFPSGRAVVWQYLPILLISPITTTLWPVYVIVHYLIVFIGFSLVLYLDYRKICTEWSIFHTKIILLSDAQIIAWFRKTDAGQGLEDDLEFARSTLEQQVQACCRAKGAFSEGIQYPQDTFVEDLARCFAYSQWLINKYASLGKNPSAPYSSVYNSSLKVCLKSHQDFVRGLREHSSYFQFRYAKSEIFVKGAMVGSILLDYCVHVSWHAIDVLSPDHLNLAIERLYALVNFLVCLVAMDYQVQYCSAARNHSSVRSLRTVDDLEHAEASEVVCKSYLYWNTLGDLIPTLGLFFGLTTVLLCLYTVEKSELTVYLGYTLAYWFITLAQFNRVFVDNDTRVVQILCGSNAAGYLAGSLLYATTSLDSMYVGMVVTMLSGFCASVGSFVVSDLGVLISTVTPGEPYSPQAWIEKTGWRTHSQKFIGLSYVEESKLLASIATLHESSDLNRVEPLSVETHGELFSLIDSVLLTADPPSVLRQAFPDWRRLLGDVAERFRNGKIKLRLVASSEYHKHGLSQLSALGRMSTKSGEVLEVYVYLQQETIGKNQPHECTQICLTICEAIIHETCEVVLGYTHADATCAELLLSPHHEICVPSRIRHQIESRSIDVGHLIRNTATEVINQCCFGINVDVDWIMLPESLRELIVARVARERCALGGLSVPDLQSYSHMCSSDQSVSDNSILSRSHARAELAFKIDQFCRTNGIDDQEISTGLIDKPLSVAFGNTTLRPELEVLAISISPYQRLTCWASTLIDHVAAVVSGEPDLPREIMLSTEPSLLSDLLKFCTLQPWRIFAKARQFLVDYTIVYQRPDLKSFLTFSEQGVSRTLYTDRIVIDHPFNASTGFFRPRGEHGYVLDIFTGVLQKIPRRATGQKAIAVYDDQHRLARYDVLGIHCRTYHYQYKQDARIPVSRSSDFDTLVYDDKGRVTGGSQSSTTTDWTFRYSYSTNALSSDVLFASYTSPGIEVTVFWCIPCHSKPVGSDPVDEIAISKVTKVIWDSAQGRFEVRYTYTHKRNPTIKYLRIDKDMNEIAVTTIPEEILEVISRFLSRPEAIHFDQDDMLYYHATAPIFENSQNPLSRLRRSPITHRTKLSTNSARSLLWQQWLESVSLDGVTACHLDLRILRSEACLEEYWKARDAGSLDTAKSCLAMQLDYIDDKISIIDNISENTLLPIKTSDLYVMASRSCTSLRTRKVEEAICESETELSVHVLDTGCYPDQPGGVSNCRRDLVNNHTTIRNHVLSESASDATIPRFQIERGINSIKILPLWSLDHLSPHHGLFCDIPYTQVAIGEHLTNHDDIEKKFLPSLRALVKAARRQNLSRRDLVECTDAFVNLSIYFEDKAYTKTWRSASVKHAWRRLWLENPCELDDQPRIASPSLANLDEALELWIRYLFILSIRIPTSVPTVFQCTHHGVSSLYGMLLKIRRGTTYMIWDHAIYWREACFNLSKSQSTLSCAVLDMLLGLIRIASQLSYMHADVVVPCTNVFNPRWETELGTDQGRRAHRNAFRRNIDPIVNGISDMERFRPATDQIKAKVPTVVMLSNVQFIKDVKNAILSADIIVNRFKFRKYRLLIYGAMDRTPQYASEAQAMIRTKNLHDHVILAGFGNPQEVLKDAWIFMNSSLSEGLPLAIGEAALSGCPIVATDVGATSLVITDPEDPKVRYGEVVPPNDPHALALAQIRLLAMLGPWAKYCDEMNAPMMPVIFDEENVEWITQRMYEKTKERHELGLKSREVILKSFSGARYLREHEQMYWLGNFRYHQRARLKLPSHL